MIISGIQKKVWASWCFTTLRCRDQLCKQTKGWYGCSSWSLLPDMVNVGASLSLEALVSRDAIPWAWDHSADEYLAHGLFFYEDAVQVGKTLTLYFPLAASAPLGLLPRHVADSIPFSKSTLPSVLSQLGIAKNSVQAASMEETLYMCDLPPSAAGQAKFCATSLEALVEGSMAALGTRNIRPVISDLPRSGAPKQPYTVRSVRQVDGSSFASCHDHAYPYTVYMCHNTPSTKAYMVELEGARSGLVVTVAAICHADTTHWNSDHVSFKILGTKPGGTPICHYLPYGHTVWVNSMDANNRSSSEPKIDLSMLYVNVYRVSIFSSMCHVILHIYAGPLL